MARRKRKLSNARRKKKSKALRKKPRPTRTKRKLRRRRSPTLRGRVARAYRTVVGTIRDTDRLRNKMEPPATSETE